MGVAVVTGTFVFRLRKDIDLDAYQQAQFRMYEIVSGDPAYGFISIDSYESASGETVLMAEFESYDGMQAWRQHPEHLVTQERGRTEWFESYWGAQLIRLYEWDPEGGRRVLAEPVL